MIHTSFPSHSQRSPAYSHIDVTIGQIFDTHSPAMESQQNPHSNENDGESSAEAPETAIFVYGTLRRGASNHWRMSAGKWLTDATVLGRLFRIDWYPGLVLDSQGTPIQGEIYLCSSTLVKELDAFEGTIEYRRIVTTATAANGETISVQLWEYQLPTDSYSPLFSGDWLKP
jgi:gamma-glutamylcyclotransferase (GGCT)/AIG2-like uncharacterized protein YtfP